MAQILEILKYTGDAIRESYYTYWDAAVNPAFFYLSLLYIFYLFRKESFNKQQDKGILLLVAAVAFIIFCPVSAWIIMEYCIESDVYRRLLWMIPIPLLIGYAGTRFVFQEEKKAARWSLGIAITVILMVCGISLYTPQNFQKASNPYKLWDGIPQVCDVILADANPKEGEKIGVIGGVDSFIVQARQYSGVFRMPYGREAIRGFDTGENAGRIYDILFGGNFSPNELAYCAKRGNYPYLVYQANQEMVSAFQEIGYELLKEVAGYHIYKLDLEKVSDILVTRYGQNQGDPKTFYTIETTKGKLIVVDGGSEAEEEYVRGVLAEKGKKVDAWILTAFRSEHMGAFCKIYKNPGDLKIKKVYTPKIPKLNVFTQNVGEKDFYQEFRSLNIRKVHHLKLGRERKIAGVTFKVLSDYGWKIKRRTENLSKDGSLVFQILGKTEKMLFCSDLGSQMIRYLQKKYPNELQSEYLQLPNHGQGQLDLEFYEKVNPKIMFFDAPSCLFEENSPENLWRINRDILAESQAKIICQDGVAYSVQIH